LELATTGERNYSKIIIEKEIYFLLFQILVKKRTVGRVSCWQLHLCPKNFQSTEKTIFPRKTSNFEESTHDKDYLQFKRLKHWKRFGSGSISFSNQFS